MTANVSRQNYSMKSKD